MDEDRMWAQLVERVGKCPCCLQPMRIQFPWTLCAETVTRTSRTSSGVVGLATSWQSPTGRWDVTCPGCGWVGRFTQTKEGS